MSREASTLEEEEEEEEDGGAKAFTGPWPSCLWEWDEVDMVACPLSTETRERRVAWRGRQEKHRGKLIRIFVYLSECQTLTHISSFPGVRMRVA